MISEYNCLLIGHGNTVCSRRIVLIIHRLAANLQHRRRTGSVWCTINYGKPPSVESTSTDVHVLIHIEFSAVRMGVSLITTNGHSAYI